MTKIFLILSVLTLFVVQSNSNNVDTNIRSLDQGGVRTKGHILFFFPNYCKVIQNNIYAGGRKTGRKRTSGKSIKFKGSLNLTKEKKDAYVKDFSVGFNLLSNF